MPGLRTESLFRLPALAWALATWVGCAGTAPEAPPAATESQTARAVREEFDPRSIQEDLLLIHPNFPRPRATAALAVDPAPAAESVAAAPGPFDVDAGLPLFGTEADAPATSPGGAPPQPSFRVETGTEHVYRVQIMAVSNESIARERAEGLRQKLGAPVFVKAQGPLFVVRVGSYTTRKEAGAMKDRVAAMHNDYRESYVVGVDETRELRIPIFTEPGPVTPPAPVEPVVEPEPELVPAFGWRVLLSQYLTNEDAVKERRKIMRHYKRDDVDVSFAAPWYKVEVGHFAIDEEAKAQELAEYFKSKGYDALRVRSQVLLPQTEN